MKRHTKRKKKNVKTASPFVLTIRIGKGTATAVGTAVIGARGTAGVVPMSKKEKQRRLFATMHLKRWEAVKKFKQQGMTWTASYRAASDDLKNTPWAGGEEAIKTSYQIHQKESGARKRTG